MDFEEVIKWLYSFQRFGIKLGLERINYISEKLGNPHNKYKIIHVGGTNGKGSVCKFLESILMTEGYTVGVYTSPHLQNITERITINNKRITKKELVSQVKKIKPIIEKMIKDKNNPTFFEVFTAITFEYFKEKKVDLAIIEVGLGGRYDATNIVKPLITVITNVTLEHQDLLGKKVEQIAFEKAGIIKDNIPIITSTKGKSLNIIEKIANEKNAPLIKIKDSNWKRIKNDDLGQNFHINGFFEKYSAQTSLKGKYQGENITLSIATIELLNKNGYNISTKNIINGVKKTVYPGRMEVISHNPYILLDGAHNIEGIRVLTESLENDYKFDKLILIIGILSDKNVEDMLKKIIPLADIIITTKPNSDRAAEPITLKNIIQKIDKNKKTYVKNQIEKSIEYAKSVAGEDDLICITGSLFTVGEARKHLITGMEKC